MKGHETEAPGKPPAASRPPRSFWSRLEVSAGVYTARFLRVFFWAEHRERHSLDGEAVRRILLVRPNHRIGNSILATPAIDIFRRAFPGAEVDVLLSPIGEKIFRNLPVHCVHVFTGRYVWRPWRLWSLLRDVRRRRYDLAVDCGFGSRIDAFLVAVSGARLKIGVENDVNGFLYNIRVPMPEQVGLHKEAKWEIFARGLGLEYRGERMRLELSASERDWAARWLEREGLREPPVAVFTGGRARKGKRWPLAGFVKTVHLLDKNGRRVIVFLGPEEANLATELAAALPPAALLVCEPDIRLAAALIERCALFISGDSGPMHIACGLRVPVLAIFLKDNWNRWGPRPDRGRVLSGTDLGAERVVQEALEMLSGRRPV